MITLQSAEELVLVQRVAGGDRAAFRLLVERHQGPLSAYVGRMLSDRDAAKDIVQETFLRLWTRAARYDVKAARLTTWLHNIAHNLCVDSFRKNARMSYGNEESDVPDAKGDLESQRTSERLSERVRSVVGSLPERQRSALLMCHYQGLSNKEAAVILDVSVDALESLLARARRRLKQELSLEYES